MHRAFFFILISFFLHSNLHAQEIFADYFDIEWGATTGTEVMGRINLKCNKDYQSNPIPKSFHFDISSDTSQNFVITTEFDPKGRIFGVIKVDSGKVLPNSDMDYPLTMSLYDKEKLLNTQEIVINLRKAVLWSQLQKNYLPFATQITKLYGRFTYTDEELAITIDELIKQDGKFRFSKMYGAHPSDYVELVEQKNMTTQQKRNIRNMGIEGDWVNVLKHIGGLGYAYAHSKEFGINARDKRNTQKLKKAIYLSTYQFMSNVGIEGDEVLIDGKPAGPYLGDGFVTLNEHNLISHEMCTHQWEMADALASPLAHIMPELLEDKASGDTLAQALYDEMRDYFQLLFAEVRDRRVMDKWGRWGKMSDVNYSNGAWSDANIDHRYRTLMLLPIVYADYNQPITYVPYWYDDFYNGTEFEGMTFVRGLSPSGVISDLKKLSNLFSSPSYLYAQSGFNPDGSISHHSDHASDVAMYDYGFHWMVNKIVEGKFWKSSSKPIDVGALQRVANRYNLVYNNIIYKNRLDFTIIGRSHLSNTKKFAETEFIDRGKELLDLVPTGHLLKDGDQIESLLEGIENNTHAHDTSMAFWNADFVIHRKESSGNQYYFSVKNKSKRTIGAEDFSEIRKSWHFGSGVFQLKIDGNEYEQAKLNKWDHHVIPGVTEEWRTDKLPTGHSAASGPGLNEFSGQLADGKNAMAGYHHMPSDQYGTANAYKSYYMIKNIGIALGSDISRARKGQGKNIVTTIDQNYFDSPITYYDGHQIHTLNPKESHDIALSPNKDIWIHQGDKGYLIFPEPGQKIFIKTNDYVNITNRLDSTFIRHYTGHYYLHSPKYGSAVIAIDHGKNPGESKLNQYHYALVANVSSKDMPEQLNSYTRGINVLKKKGTFHAVNFINENLIQISFFKASRVNVNPDLWIETDHPALIMIDQNDGEVVFSLSNPLHTLNLKQMVINTNLKLKAGLYSYCMKGINEQPGEQFLVERDKDITTITIELPDSSDAERYKYQEMMYAGSPLLTTIPIEK